MLVAHRHGFQGCVGAGWRRTTALAPFCFIRLLLVPFPIWYPCTAIHQQALGLLLMPCRHQGPCTKGLCIRITHCQRALS